MTSTDLEHIVGAVTIVAPLAALLLTIAGAALADRADRNGGRK